MPTPLEPDSYGLCYKKEGATAFEPQLGRRLIVAPTDQRGLGGTDQLRVVQVLLSQRTPSRLCPPLRGTAGPGQSRAAAGQAAAARCLLPSSRRRSTAAASTCRGPTSPSTCRASRTSCARRRGACGGADGGVYVPTLSQKIYQAGAAFGGHMKGYLVGNGVFDHTEALPLFSRRAVGQRQPPAGLERSRAREPTTVPSEGVSTAMEALSAGAKSPCAGEKEAVALSKAAEDSMVCRL